MVSPPLPTQRVTSEKNLHAIDGPPNPYLTALSLIARTLESFDADNLIPCYGFGDVSTRAQAVFSLQPGNQPSQGLQNLLLTYRRVVSSIQLSGPTSFGPLILQAMREVYFSQMQFTVLLIVADGQISRNCLEDTTKAIVEASLFPLSIVMIGVGDGPWDKMQEFDDALPTRKWDNFQFVEFEKLMRNAATLTREQGEAYFALHALMELPDQYKVAQFLTGPGSMPKVEHIIKRIPPRVLIEPPYRLNP